MTNKEALEKMEKDCDGIYKCHGCDFEGCELYFAKKALEKEIASEGDTEENAPENEKPVLGIRPRYVANNERATEICEGLLRFLKAGDIDGIKREWVEELSEILHVYADGAMKKEPWMV